MNRMAKYKNSCNHIGFQKEGRIRGFNELCFSGYSYSFSVFLVGFFLVFYFRFFFHFHSYFIDCTLQIRRALGTYTIIYCQESHILSKMSRINKAKDPRTLFINEYPSYWNEEPLREYFSKYGDIHNMYILELGGFESREKLDSELYSSQDLLSI